MYHRFLYYVHVSKVHLGDFAHNVGQWILSYAIKYDETIGSCIYGHILLAIKFYAYVHRDTLDEFVLSRAINDYKRPFLDKWEYVE